MKTQHLENATHCLIPNACVQCAKLTKHWYCLVPSAMPVNWQGLSDATNCLVPDQCTRNAHIDQVLPRWCSHCGTSAGATDQNSRVLIFCRIVWLFRQSFYVKGEETSRNDESQMVKRFGFFGVGMSDFLCVLGTTCKGFGCFVGEVFL